MKFWNSTTIKQAREVFKVTQEQLAKELGTRQQTISEWELGLYSPGNSYQKLLSMAFDEIAKRRENNVCTSGEK